MAVPAAAFANRMSKAAREIKINASRSAAHRPGGSQRAGQQPVRHLSERDVLRAIRPGMGPGQPGAYSTGRIYAVEARPLCSRYVAEGVLTWLSGATAS